MTKDEFKEIRKGVLEAIYEDIAQGDHYAMWQACSPDASAIAYNVNRFFDSIRTDDSKT